MKRTLIVKVVTVLLMLALTTTAVAANLSDQSAGISTPGVAGGGLAGAGTGNY